MIRCAWCGATNYAIDSWCASCLGHLDWSPPSRTPRQSPRRPRVMVLAPAAAIVGVVGILLALSVASWFSAVGRPQPSVPDAALRPAAPAATTTAAAQAVATPDATSTPQATPGPTETSTPALPSPDGVAPSGSDPAASVALFYQAVSSHDFAAAAALWTPRMQAQFPPAEFIDHRFTATQQINLQGERLLGSGDGVAIVYVRIVEVIGGHSRRWVGTWQLVNTGSGWLLNRPNLRADS